MRQYEPTTQNCTDFENRTTNNDNDSNTTRCISCGEERIERYKLTLRQPLQGNAYGRIIETGSVCGQCATEMRNNAHAEERQ